MKETLDVILMTTQNYVNVNDEYLFWLFSWYLLNDLVRKETCLHLHCIATRDHGWKKHKWIKSEMLSNRACYWGVTWYIV